jgi:hypothetical protein
MKRTHSIRSEGIHTEDIPRGYCGCSIYIVKRTHSIIYRGIIAAVVLDELDDVTYDIDDVTYDIPRGYCGCST